MSRILFRKEGRAIYISHLDLMRTMQRAFIRAGVELKHSEGFNPHPLMVFPMPLSVGTSSECEILDFTPVGEISADTLLEKVNAALPEGITVTECYESAEKLKKIEWLRAGIELIYDMGVPDNAEGTLKKLFSRDALEIEKTSKGKTRTVDIAPLITDFTVKRKADDTVYFEALYHVSEPMASPNMAISAVEKYLPELKPDFTRVRRLEVYDENKKIFR